MRVLIWTFILIGALYTNIDSAKAVAILQNQTQQNAELNNAKDTNDLTLIRGGKNGGEGGKSFRHHKRDGGSKTFRQHRSSKDDHKTYRHHKRQGSKKHYSHSRGGKQHYAQKRHRGDRQYSHRRGHHDRQYAHKRHRGDSQYRHRRGHHDRQYAHKRHRGDRQYAHRRGHHDRQYAHKNYNKERRYARSEKGNKEKHENWKNGYDRNHKNGYYRKGKGSREDQIDTSDNFDEVFESDADTVEPESIVAETGRGMMERAQDRVMDEVFRRIMP